MKPTSRRLEKLGNLYCERKNRLGNFQCKNLFRIVSNHELEIRFHLCASKTHIDCLIYLCYLIHRLFSGYAVSLSFALLNDKALDSTQRELRNL